jgi:hypothetical protein
VSTADRPPAATVACWMVVTACVLCAESSARSLLSASSRAYCCCRPLALFSEPGLAAICWRTAAICAVTCAWASVMSLVSSCARRSAYTLRVAFAIRTACAEELALAVMSTMSVVPDWLAETVGRLVRPSCCCTWARTSRLVITTSSPWMKSLVSVEADDPSSCAAVTASSGCTLAMVVA